MATGSQNLTTDKARILSTEPGTSMFWRGDNSWSNALLNTLWVDYIGSSADISSRLTSIDFSGIQAGTAGRTKMRLDIVSGSITENAPPITSGTSAGYLHTYFWDTSTDAASQLYIPNGDHLTSTNGPQCLMVRGNDNGTWSSWINIPTGTGVGASGTWGINVTGTASHLSSAPNTTDTFYRGDKTWTNHLTGGIILDGTTPLTMQGLGSGTYTKSIIYCNSSGITLETPRATDGSTGTILPFMIKTRGGNWGITQTGTIEADIIGIRNTSATTGYGISLYGGPIAGAPTYGIMFAGTATYGAHNVVGANDWATYLTMSNTESRGWIFRRGTTNVASISGAGILTLGSKFSYSTFTRCDTNDRPGIAIFGNYPQIVLMSGAISNTSHGPTLSFSAFDTANATSGNFQTFTFGCPGTNATWLDLGYNANQTNPHANGINAYGTNAKRLVRWNSSGVINNYYMSTFCSQSNSTQNYTTAAFQVREYNYGGAQTDNWSTAPRLGFHWGNRNAAQIGMGSNGYLYECPGTGTTFYKLMYESGTWGISITGSSASCTGNAATASAVAWTGVTGRPTIDKTTVLYQISRGANFDPIQSGYFTGMTTSSGITSDWWHIISMDWTGNDANNWISQLALPTQNRTGVYYRSRHGSTTYAWKKLWTSGESITNAVWNDYAEYRESDCDEFGYVLTEKGDDTLTKTTERLQHFAGISSNTWGFAQGETDKAKTPIAVAGRVLCYPYRNRQDYKPGDPLCAAPGGTVDIMTREEVMLYPDRIVGTVSCVPDYEEWGGSNLEIENRPPIKVNGRIWVKIR